MNTLQQEIAFWNSVDPKVQGSVRRTLQIEAISLRDKIANAAPFVTGEHKRSWRMKLNTIPGSIASAIIFNPLLKASALEYGIDPSSDHTWALSIKDRTQKQVVKSKGAIWSADAIGGTMLPSFNASTQQKVSRSIADSVIEVLK